MTEFMLFILQIALSAGMVIVGVVRVIKTIRQNKAKSRETEWKMRVFLESLERR